MRKFLIWATSIVVGLVVVVLAAGWLLLYSGLFTDLRRNIVESVLTDQIGQPLVINDDVWVRPNRIATVFIGGVVIPSENMEGTNLAELDTASFQVDLYKLLVGQFHIDNLDITKLHVNMLTAEDKTTSWTKEELWTTEEPQQETEKTAEEELKRSKEEPAGQDIMTVADAPQTGLFRFLSDKTARVKDIQLTVDNKWTGFEFSFQLKSLALEQLEGGALISLTSDGTVNDRPFEIAGTFPRGKPFEASASIGGEDGTALQVEGAPYPEDKGEGYTATATLTVGSLGNLLETIRLERAFDGDGQLTAHIDANPDKLQITDLEADVDFEKGQTLAIAGGVENVLEMNSPEAGIDLAVDLNLQPPDKPIERAKKIADIRLISIDGRIISAGLGIELADLKVETNAFNQDLRNIGPVSVHRIFRTPDGELSLDDVDIQIGPEGRPIIRAGGDIRDVLEFEGIELEGKISAPADLLLTTLEPAQVAEFGSVNGEFTISDASGNIAITGFKGYSQDSDLWSLDAKMSVVDVKNFTGMDFRFDLGIADGARFLEALQLKSVDAGELGFSGAISGDKLDLESTYEVQIDQSIIDLTLNSNQQNDDLIIRGSMLSDEIHIADLRDAVSAGLQLRNLVAGSGRQSSDKEVLPLVIEEPKEDPDAKPAPDSDVEVIPLVIEEDTELVSGERILEKLDLLFNIDIKKIVGQEGVSGIKSDLSLKQGQLEFGPLKANYGGGYFNVNAAMNLLNSTEIMRVSGSTGGWDFGEILNSIGVGMDAYGILRGNFDLTGNISSARTFLNTMGGNVTIRMSNGRIATSLLELAGLGIFGWLFSEERVQGYTNIVCINAPVRINAGRVSSNAIVAETRSVQVVVQGQVDWRRDTIALRGEPRPVGKPLRRSAFPFEVRGKLSKPDFKIRLAGLPGQRGQGRSGQTARGRVPCVPDRRQ